MNKRGPSSKNFWVAQGRKKVRCTEYVYLSCTCMPQCLLQQMSSKLSRHVLAAVSADCAVTQPQVLFFFSSGNF